MPLLFVRCWFILAFDAFYILDVGNSCAGLQKFLFAAGELAQDKPVVVSKFILNAKEIEFDGVAQEGKILNYAISEHVEVIMSEHRVWCRGCSTTYAVECETYWNMTKCTGK